MTSPYANILDPDSADTGLGKIAWAQQFMPALAEAKARATRSGLLQGRRIGIFLTLEPKTAALAIAFKEIGAVVSVHCPAAQTNDETAAALASLGVDVFARSDADAELDRELMNRFIDGHPEFIVDDGAVVARYIHTERRDALEWLQGVAEETTSGVRPLRVMEQENTLEVPCVAVNDAKVKYLFDNVYGTGQSVVMTLVDVTNIQLQGKKFVVIGYGWVGRGIARCAHALGARVVVTEIDPVRALVAIHDGYRVEPLATACRDGDVFITATGVARSLTGDHMRLMKDGAIVSVGGTGPEVDLGGSDPVRGADLARAAVRTIPVGDDRTVFLIADGGCSNVTAAEGNPIEIMDLSLAVQMRAVEHLAAGEGRMDNLVHPVPTEIDDDVALSLLRAMDVELDEPTSDQLRDVRSWRPDLSRGHDGGRGRQ